MADYRPTIGLEIHAELNTRSKMFCGCINNPDEERPNTNICPVCMAHPGTLPVINKEAIHKVLLVGTALGARLADRTYFDRKNYFYPDIPKGFQTSQYKDPLVSGGELAGVAITRVHLEEDTARSQHEGDKSLIDFNRAGVPLMELVTEPCITSAETAGIFARELQLLLWYLKASEANMEKGEMRVEANISVSKNETFGTKVEVKNLNSFRSVERAIAYEIKRQSEALEKGGAVMQETRGWDEQKQATFPMRKKESSHDYRYFPEPDLPELVLSEIPGFSPEALKKEMPELPWQRRERYSALGLKNEDAEMYVRSSFYGGLFDAVVQELKDPSLFQTASNFISSDLAGFYREALPNKVPFSISEFAELIYMYGSGTISSRGAKDILAVLSVAGGSPGVIAKEKGLMQQSDEGTISEVAKKIIEANPAVVADYKTGKTSALQFLIGQGMKETKGSANPGVLKSMFEKLLT
ncbi:MAG TPA: Asp-tRNA(Asn)/Glu-tRNA(Gln) amidotransferase subunit GatB [Candidatus Paceibacterota bacterium]